MPPATTAGFPDFGDGKKWLKLLGLYLCGRTIWRFIEGERVEKMDLAGAVLGLLSFFL